jgi:NAD(P)-dependent dehydrogenase (short-subunit alcohol dehydrogenase family)
MAPTDASYPSLKGRPVLITGGASGISESIVEHFAAQESRVTFLDIQREAGEALTGRIVALGLKRPLFLECDLTDLDALKAAVAMSAERHGAPLTLINNAGNDDRHKVEPVTPEYWQNRMDTNLRHQFFASQAVRHGQGRDWRFDQGTGPRTRAGAHPRLAGLGDDTAPNRSLAGRRGRAADQGTPMPARQTHARGYRSHGSVAGIGR